MSIKVSQPAIILRRVAYGDADWIVTFFTREMGRVTGIAKFARVSRRRFGGALEPGTVVQMSYSERRGQGLVRLEEAQARLPMNGAMKSLERIGGVARVLALAFLQEGEANPEKFDLLCERLAGLSQRDPGQLDTAAFELRWLAMCGYAPVLGGCVACGEGDADSGRWSFDFERGGLCCPSCRTSGSAVRLVAEARRGLGALSAGDAELDEVCAGAAREMLGRYIDHVVGRPLAVR